MANKLDWAKFGEGKKQQTSDRKGLKFVELGKKAIGKTHTVRPVGSPVAFWEFSIQSADGKWRFAIVDDIENCPIIAKHNIKPSEVYAINVIDRADNTIKILKGKTSIFSVFKDYNSMTGKSPGGINGADFTIEITGQKGKDYYKTEFKAKTPLSNDEQEFLKKEGLFKLEDIFKAVPCEKLEEVLGLGAVPATPANNAKTVARAPKSAALNLPEDSSDASDEAPDEAEKELDF
jgi:hypothetical protein